MSTVTHDNETDHQGAIATQVPALYDAVVMHSRKTPIVNRFRYKATYWLVDFDNLPERRGLFGHLVRFDHSDHSDIRKQLQERGLFPERILMLAMARTFGHVFNPISVYWCYDGDGKVIEVLCEVHNTYGQSHTYFLDTTLNEDFIVEKMMYVSPFYPVDGHYEIKVSDPFEAVAVSVTMRRENDAAFIATLRGTRKNVGPLRLLSYTLRRPALRVAFLIRWQAIRLMRRGLRIQPR